MHMHTPCTPCTLCHRLGHPPPTKAWSPAAQSQLAAIAQSRRRTHNRELPHVSPPPLPGVRVGALWQCCTCDAVCVVQHSQHAHAHALCMRALLRSASKASMVVPPECKLRGSVSLGDGCRSGHRGTHAKTLPTASFASCAHKQGTAVELEAAEARNFVSEPFAHPRVEPPVMAGLTRANVDTMRWLAAPAHACAM